MPVVIKNPGGPVVGLDIGSNYIKACQAQVNKGRPEVTALAVLPTPSDTVSGTEIIDPVALGRALKQLFAQTGIKARKVVSAVAGQSSLVVRIIEVPKMSQKELQETMKWEVERHVPFAAEQTVMDFQPLSSPDDVADGQNMEVLLAVAQEEMVQKHVAALQAAGLQPKAIDIEPLAASRALVSMSDGGQPSGTVALIDIGANTTDISIFREGRIAFTRSIQIAGNSITKAISDVLGQPLPQAERLKKELAVAPEIAGGVGDMGMGGGFDTDLPDLGGFDFGVPGGETVSFDAPVGAAPEAIAAGEPAFDVAGSGVGSSPFAETVDGPVFDDPMGQAGGPAQEAAPPAAAATSPGAFSFDLPGASSQAEPTPGQAPSFAADELFGAPPASDPFAAESAAASPFDAPFAPGPAPDAGGMLPTPAAPAPAGSDEYVRQQVTDAITPVLSELVTELRRSLDFFANRAGGHGAQRIVISGGTAKLPGLDRFLSQNLGAPVNVANAMEHVAMGAHTDEAYLKEVAPLFPVCVGLAVRDMLVEAAPPRPRGKK